MKIVTALDQLTPHLSLPVALTIGTYDGVHAGHQSVFKALRRSLSGRHIRAVVTFSNHPRSLLIPGHVVPLVTTLAHRLYLFEQENIDLVILFPFTQVFSQRSYQNFLSDLFLHLPFKSLVLGKGACFGKHREGTEGKVRTLGKKVGFSVEYVKKEHYHHQTISGSMIREAIERGELRKIKKWLKRAYSFYLPFPMEREDREEGVFRYVFSFKGMCHLPSAVYSVTLEGEEKIPAIAFLRGSTPLGGERELSCALFSKKRVRGSCFHCVVHRYLCDTLSSSLLQSDEWVRVHPIQPSFV